MSVGYWLRTARQAKLCLTPIIFHSGERADTRPVYRPPPSPLHQLPAIAPAAARENTPLSGNHSQEAHDVVCEDTTEKTEERGMETITLPNPRGVIRAPNKKRGQLAKSHQSVATSLRGFPLFVEEEEFKKITTWSYRFCKSNRCQGISS